MSSRGGNINIKNLDKWQAWLQQCEKEDVDQCKGRILRSIGLRGLEYAQDFTPRRTSALAGSLSMGGRGNVFEVTIGNTSHVVFGTNVSYAEYVEEGFTQNKGQFVPGYWSSGTFHYDPEADGGMVLTGATVEGAHMFRKAMDALEAGDIDKIAEFELRRLYANLTK